MIIRSIVNSVILCHMEHMGANIEVNRAYIVLDGSEIFRDDEWSAATRVLFPEANRARHCALAIHLVCPHPCILYVVVSTRLNRQLIFISAEC